MSKQEGKEYSDNRRRASVNDIQSGDKVLAKQQQNNKLSLPYNPQPYTFVSKQGPEVTVKSKKGVTYRRRSIAYIKKYP